MHDNVSSLGMTCSMPPTSTNNYPSRSTTMEISYSVPLTCANGYQPSTCVSQLVPPICSPNYIPVTTVTEDLRNNTYQAPQRTSHIDPNTQYLNHYQYQPFNNGTKQNWSAEYQNDLYTRYAQTQNFVTPSLSWHESSNTGYETRISSPCHPPLINLVIITQEQKV